MYRPNRNSQPRLILTYFLPGLSGGIDIFLPRFHLTKLDSTSVMDLVDSRARCGGEDAAETLSLRLSVLEASNWPVLLTPDRK